MHVLGIIPARGGSRGIPGKNIRMLGGKPLLQYTAEAAQAAKLLGRVILSTDDPKIAAMGRELGLDVPFMRPAELAQDKSPTLPVVQHGLGQLELEGEQYDAVCLLQPTHPFRRPEHIDGCIELLERTGADSVMTVLPVPLQYNPHWVYFANEDGELELSTGDSAPIPRRQELPPAYHREGSVYVTLRDVIMTGSLYGRRVAGFLMDSSESVNIDTEADWERAAQMLEAGLIEAVGR